MTKRLFARSLLSLVLGLATIGCSRSKDDLPREPVAGQVTIDGKPLPEAAIQFTPTGDTAATTFVAEVKDGKFSIPREDGLAPGTYRVSISHAEPEQVKTKKATGALSKSFRLGKEQIPARYNTKSTLKAEIKRGGTSDLNFPLESK